MIQAIFFDLDGTLLSFKTHRMSESTKQALQRCKEKGIKLFISTGRHISELDILKSTPYFDGYITLNGCYCFNEKETIYTCTLNKEDVALAVDLVKTGQMHCIFINEHSMTVEKHSEDILFGCNLADVPLPLIEDPVLSLNKDIYQLSAYLTKENEHIYFEQAKNAVPVRWHDAFTDVVPVSASKKTGILKICEYYGFDPEKCMAFGDGENDIPMFECVKTSIAMQNANEHVKQAASYVTSSVDEDGIDLALKHFGL